MDYRGLAWVGLLGALLSASAQVHAANDAQREAFERAYGAAGLGRTSVVDRYRPQLEGYVLTPYLDYALINRNLSKRKPEEVQAFLQKHPDLGVSELLRRRYLRALAKQGRWADYAKFYTPQTSVDLRCFALRAQLRTGQPAPLDAETQDLWLTGESQHEACDPVFAHWVRSGQITPHLRLARAQLAARAGNASLARYVVRPLPGSERRLVERWIDLFDNPRRVLPQVARWSNLERHRQVVVWAIEDFARKDSESADRLWQRHRDKLGLDEDRRRWIERRLAVLRATNYPEGALARLEALPGESQDQEVHEWAARVAIFEGDWPALLRHLDAMEEAEAARSDWRYWRARALEQVGREQEAAELFAEVARDTSFYGFLAADRLQRPYALCPAEPVTDEVALAKASPGLARALELYRLDRVTDARREWRAAAPKADADALTQASVIAWELGWLDQAIIGFGNAASYHYYEQRFPMPWQRAITREANRRGFKPSILYAFMRTESAMVPTAVSGAGARGLMQLTPATARGVARRNKIRLRSPNRELLEPAKNIELAAAHLDELLEKWGHPVTVIAAYNAGASPVARWLRTPGRPMEADRFIATIPYYETRDYVPRVLTYRALYQWRQVEKMTRLSDILPPLSEKPGESAFDLGVNVGTWCPED